MILNFKDEVVDAMHASGHDFDDINFISRNGVGLNEDAFWSAADFDYDNMTGKQVIDPEFRVTFKDRTWLGRKISRGVEFFKWRSCLDKPVCILSNVSREDFAKVD